MGDDFGFEFSLKLLGIVSAERGNKRIQLSTQTVDVRIDSVVAQLWLPVDICHAFEDAFGLVWDEANAQYLVNQTLHQSLLERDITINITVGQQSHQITVDFPYSVFDLKIGPPHAETTSRYFPLRRANSSLEYILGRAFLQRAYLTADYDRRSFNLSRAVYDPKAANHIVLIPPPTDAEKAKMKTPKTLNKHTSSPSLASIAGISVGISVVLIALCLIFYHRLRQKSSQAKGEDEISSVTVQKPREDSFDSSFIKAEMDGTGKPRIELDASECEKKELGWHVTAVELDSSTPTELPGFVPIYEMKEGKRCSYEEDIGVADGHKG
jgi:hypothetical protein